MVALHHEKEEKVKSTIKEIELTSITAPVGIILVNVGFLILLCAKNLHQLLELIAFDSAVNVLHEHEREMEAGATQHQENCK